MCESFILPPVFFSVDRNIKYLVENKGKLIIFFNIVAALFDFFVDNDEHICDRKSMKTYFSLK